MTKKQNDAASKILRLRKSSCPSVLRELEGLELLQAFSIIVRVRDRKKVIELAKRLSGKDKAAD